MSKAFIYEVLLKMPASSTSTQQDSQSLLISTGHYGTGVRLPNCNIYCTLFLFVCIEFIWCVTMYLYSVRYANGKLEKRSAFNYVFFFFFLTGKLFQVLAIAVLFSVWDRTHHSLWQTYRQSRTNTVAMLLLCRGGIVCDSCLLLIFISLHPSSMSHSTVGAGLFMFMLTGWFWGINKLLSLLASGNTNSIP